jgi:hypothetical protein
VPALGWGEADAPEEALGLPLVVGSCAGLIGPKPDAVEGGDREDLCAGRVWVEGEGDDGKVEGGSV